MRWSVVESINRVKVEICFKKKTKDLMTPTAK